MTKEGLLNLAQFVGAFAGRRMDALAKADPVHEMALVHLDDLAWRIDGAEKEIRERSRAALSFTDIEARIARVLKAAGRGTGASLVASGPVHAARAQLRMVRLALQDLAHELSCLPSQGLAADDVLRLLGRMSRALFGTREGNTFVVMVLGQCVEHAVRFSRGGLLHAGPEKYAPLAHVDHELCVALGIAARSVGIAPIALHMFAQNFPEHAARLDRDSLDRIVQRAMLDRNLSQWDAATLVAKSRLGIHVSSESVVREMKRHRRECIGDPRLPEAH